MDKATTEKAIEILEELKNSSPFRSVVLARELSVIAEGQSLARQRLTDEERILCEWGENHPEYHVRELVGVIKRLTGERFT